MKISVRQVFSLLAFILTVSSTKDAMTLKFGDLNAGASDPTATPGLTNLLMRPMVGVFARAIIRVAVEGNNYPVQYEGYQCEQLMVILSLRVRSILESYPRDCNILTIGRPIRLMYVIIVTFRSMWE